MIRSLLDKGCFSWYDALNDKVSYLDEELNIIEFVQREPPAQTLPVS